MLCSLSVINVLVVEVFISWCFRQIYEAQSFQSPVLSVSKVMMSTSMQSASEVAEMILATLLPPHDIWAAYLLAVKVTGWFFFFLAENILCYIVIAIMGLKAILVVDLSIPGCRINKIVIPGFWHSILRIKHTDWSLSSHPTRLISFIGCSRFLPVGIFEL